MPDRTFQQSSVPPVMCRRERTRMLVYLKQGDDAALSPKSRTGQVGKNGSTCRSHRCRPRSPSPVLLVCADGIIPDRRKCPEDCTRRAFDGTGATSETATSPGTLADRIADPHSTNTQAALRLFQGTNGGPGTIAKIQLYGLMPRRTNPGNWQGATKTRYILPRSILCLDCRP
jgi:hypothetical protein